jgi:peptidoglycan/LPS O-acetylase OafA/YrhL
MWRHSFLALMFAGMLGLGVLSSLPFQRLFEFAPLRMLGKISFGLYLLHMPVSACVAWALPHSNHWLVVTMLFSGTIAAATASFWLLERPFLIAPLREKGVASESDADEKQPVLLVEART